MLGVIAAALHFPIDDKPLDRLQARGSLTFPNHTTSTNLSGLSQTALQRSPGYENLLDASTANRHNRDEHIRHNEKLAHPLRHPYGRHGYRIFIFGCPNDFWPLDARTHQQICLEANRNPYLFQSLG